METSSPILRKAVHAIADGEMFVDPWLAQVMSET
jgi:hypothetical protein